MQNDYPRPLFLITALSVENSSLRLKSSQRKGAVACTGRFEDVIYDKVTVCPGINLLLGPGDLIHRYLAEIITCRRDSYADKDGMAQQ